MEYDKFIFEPKVKFNGTFDKKDLYLLKMTEEEINNKYEHYRYYYLENDFKNLLNSLSENYYYYDNSHDIDFYDKLNKEFLAEDKIKLFCLNLIKKYNNVDFFEWINSSENYERIGRLFKELNNIEYFISKESINDYKLHILANINFYVDLLGVVNKPYIPDIITNKFLDSFNPIKCDEWIYEI